ncbi:MAG: TonB-dependent receptor plug domain-containing protein, partial [Pseudomonadota bacterium]
MARRPKALHLFAGTAMASLAAVHASAQEDLIVLDPIVVEGSQVELALPYSGGQVASGGRVGFLGNNQYSDLPFSGTAYTSEFIENRQAASVGDVLLNDPTVRVAAGFGNFQEVYQIRGFAVFSDDITLNGVYGILPRQTVAAPLVERVEILRGANAFVNGAAPGGSGVGGIINIVPKRAPEEGITSLTLGYESDGQFFGTADFGRRFGEEGEWGVRVGATGRIGETSVEDADQSFSAFSLGVDYDGEGIRFNADLGYQNNVLDDPRPQVTPLGAVPALPDADANYAQPFTFAEEEQIFFAARGEIDLTNEITAWLAGGFRFGDESNDLANPNSDAAGNLSSFRFVNTREDTVYSIDGGIRAEFTTGPIDHRLTFSGSFIDQDFENAFAFSDFGGFSAGSLTNPIAVAPPPTTAFV